MDAFKQLPRHDRGFDHPSKSAQANLKISAGAFRGLPAAHKLANRLETVRSSSLRSLHLPALSGLGALGLLDWRRKRKSGNWF